MTQKSQNFGQQVRAGDELKLDLDLEEEKKAKQMNANYNINPKHKSDNSALYGRPRDKWQQPMKTARVEYSRDET